MRIPIQAIPALAMSDAAFDVIGIGLANSVFQKRIYPLWAEDEHVSTPSIVPGQE
jgi:hypothetical protein